MSDNHVIPEAAIDAAARAIEFHLTDRAQESGCALRCGYAGDDMSVHMARHILEAASPYTREPLISADQWAACYTLKGELVAEPSDSVAR